MKKIKTILLSLAVLSCGTDQGKGALYKYTVKNESGVSIKIKSYLSRYPEVSPIITYLSVGEELTKTHQDGLPPSTYNFANFFGEENTPHRDSIVVIYGNNKISSLKEGCAGSARNPLNSCLYRGLEETFVFTKEDYENAKECNGSCD